MAGGRDSLGNGGVLRRGLERRRYARVRRDRLCLMLGSVVKKKIWGTRAPQKWALSQSVGMHVAIFGISEEQKVCRRFWIRPRTTWRSLRWEEYVAESLSMCKFGASGEAVQSHNGGLPAQRLLLLSYLDPAGKEFGRRP